MAAPKTVLVPVGNGSEEMEAVSCFWPPPTPLPLPLLPESACLLVRLVWDMMLETLWLLETL